MKITNLNFPTFKYYFKKEIRNIILRILLSSFFLSVLSGNAQPSIDRNFLPYAGNANYYVALAQNNINFESLFFDSNSPFDPSGNIVYKLPYQYYNREHKKYESDIFSLLYNGNVKRSKKLFIVLTDSSYNEKELQSNAINDEEYFSRCRCNVKYIMLTYHSGWLKAAGLAVLLEGKKALHKYCTIDYSGNNVARGVHIHYSTPGHIKDKTDEYDLQLKLDNKTNVVFAVFNNDVRTHYTYAADGSIDSVTSSISARTDTIFYDRDTFSAGNFFAYNKYRQNRFVTDSILGDDKLQRNKYLILLRQGVRDTIGFSHESAEGKHYIFSFITTRSLSGNLRFFSERDYKNEHLSIMTSAIDNAGGDEYYKMKADPSGGNCLKQMFTSRSVAEIKRDESGQPVSVISLQFVTDNNNMVAQECTGALSKMIYTLPAGISEKIVTNFTIQKYCQYTINYLPDGLAKEIRFKCSNNDAGRQNIQEVNPFTSGKIYFLHKTQ